MSVIQKHAAQTLQPEIQGLRAVAVLAVLIFHVWPDLLPGGYVGVDVFFVISGYLITGLLLREAQNTGGISLSIFYARRIRRLLPASASVIFVSCLFIGVLPEVQWADTAKEALASSLYLQNWWLAHQAVDYLAEETAPSVLRHYWSLSVEEQYYIFWPLICLLAVRYRPKDPERSIGKMAIMIGVLSLLYSVYLTRHNSGLAYFSSGTRAWELALGSGLAVYRKYLRLLPPIVHAMLGWLGVALIAVASVTFSETTIFPGYAAILPTVGAALAIAGGRTSRWWAGSRLLDFKPMRYVGDLSYSLYLWHWPVLIFFEALLGPSRLEWRHGFWIICVSVLLAHVTKQWVEDPFRYGAWRRWKLLNSPRVILATSLGLALLVTAPIMLKFERSDVPPLVRKVAPYQLEQTYNPRLPTVPPVAAARGDNPDVYRLNCHVDQRGTEPRHCSFGPPSAQRVVVLVGDSHAAQWLPALQELFHDQPEWRIVTYTKSACAFNAVKVTVGKQGLPYESCSEWNQQVMAELDELRPDVIIMSASANYRVYGVEGKEASLKALTDGLIERWRQLLQTGGQLVVLRDTPRMNRNIPDCISASRVAGEDCSTPLAEALRPDPIVMGLQRMPADTARLTYLDLTDEICEATECRAVKGQVLIWRDSHHMTATYARSLSAKLRELLVEKKVL